MSVSVGNQELYNAYTCMHCQMHITNIKDVPTHYCFIGKDVYTHSNNVLYTPEVDESAVWTDTATMALLSLYEAHRGMLDNPKKQGKLWQTISDELLESFGIESQRLLERPQSVDLRKEPLRRTQRPQSLHSPVTTSVLLTETSTIIPQEGRSDPRELPRPAKYGMIQSSKQPAPKRSILQYCYMNPVCQDNNTLEQDDQYMASTGCTCTNCTTLPSLTECGICLEPLQGRKVHSCPICANLMCKCCSLKMETCPFCRTTLPPMPNIALERLLERLALPCKNSRSGCAELVDGDSRKNHEAVCNHGTFSCPVGSHICGWHGDLVRIEDHLQKAHDLRPIVDNGIAVEISGFRGKAYAKDGRQYTVCLSCHEHLYVVKIVLFQGKLRLSFSQLGTSSVLQPKIVTDPTRTYGVWMEVGSTSKVLKGALPFGKRNCDTREIEITCDNIITRDENDSGGSVKIKIVIKPITVV